MDRQETERSLHQIAGHLLRCYQTLDRQDFAPDLYPAISLYLEDDHRRLAGLQLNVHQRAEYGNAIAAVTGMMRRVSEDFATDIRDWNVGQEPQNVIQNLCSILHLVAEGLSLSLIESQLQDQRSEHYAN